MSRTAVLKLPTASHKRQLLSKALWNSMRSAEKADFFTFGYSGRSIEAVIDALITHDVRTLVDVRTNAVSMYRPEFSKGNLRTCVETNGMLYVHCPEFGVPRDIRSKAISAGSRDVIWQWYDEHVGRTYVGSNLHLFLNSLEHPIAFMCSELDPVECHRHRLGLILEKAGLRSFDL